MQEGQKERQLSLPLVDGPGGSEAFLSLAVLRAKRSEISDTHPIFDPFPCFPWIEALKPVSVSHCF